MDRKETPPYVFVNYLTERKTKWEDLTKDEQNDFQPYIVNKFLAQHRDLVKIVNIIQKGKQLPKENIYKMYLEILPNYRMFSKYIKKNIEDDYPKELLTLVSKFRKNNFVDAKIFLDSLSKDELIKILNGYHIEEKQIEQWTKKK